MPRRVFVSFEGGEGSGKTTQATILHNRLVKEGYATSLVHEPGSTELGWYLRGYLKSKGNISREAELLLFVAARVELVNAVIRPSLNRGMSIVADRYADSSVAYQGYGRKIDLEMIQSLNDLATGGLMPDITFLMDIEPEKGLRAIGQPQLRLPLESGSEQSPVRQDQEGQRQFEEQPLEFHRRVREGYLKLAAQDLERWVVVDAGFSVDEVSEQVWGKVAQLLTKSPTTS